MNATIFGSPSSLAFRAGMSLYGMISKPGMYGPKPCRVGSATQSVMFVKREATVGNGWPVGVVAAALASGRPQGRSPSHPLPFALPAATPTIPCWRCRHRRAACLPLAAWPHLHPASCTPHAAALCAHLIAVWVCAGADGGGGAPPKVFLCKQDLGLVLGHPLDVVAPAAGQLDCRLAALHPRVHGQHLKGGKGQPHRRGGQG
jgi:hypothetical protein